MRKESEGMREIVIAIIAGVISYAAYVNFGTFVGLMVFGALTCIAKEINN